jgi:arylsulfatase A-like enzyme
MKPNILFIIIDGLRNDKCHGPDKTSFTPNLDLLISDGTYFNNTISSSDGTRTCVGSIFTAQYPFQSGLTTFDNHKKTTRFFDFLKNKGYSLVATVPDVDLWKTLTKNFDEKILIPKPYEYLFDGTGNKILNQLKHLTDISPWIYYIHIMDLHRSVNFNLPEQYKDKKFGSNDYEKMVSAIDFWLGEILKKINLSQTLIVITSDHGEFIPISNINHEINYIPSLVKVGQKFKKFTPKSLQPTGESVFVKIRDSIMPIRKSLLKTKLSETEMRTLNIRGSKLGWELFDEVVCTPLLFSGYNVKSNTIVNQQVRQIDIFPTILSIMKSEPISKEIEGVSLLSLIHEEKTTEKPALIENQLLDPNDNDVVIGIRTSNYKYFRNINDKNVKVCLFNLKTDPHEQNNIASVTPDIVKQMEDLLMKYRKNVAKSLITHDQDETSKIKEELKKMGYI